MNPKIKLFLIQVAATFVGAVIALVLFHLVMKQFEKPIPKLKTEPPQKPKQKPRSEPVPEPEYQEPENVHYTKIVKAPIKRQQNEPFMDNSVRKVYDSVRRVYEEPEPEPEFDLYANARNNDSETLEEGEAERETE